MFFIGFFPTYLNHWKQFHCFSCILHLVPSESDCGTRTNMANNRAKPCMFPLFVVVFITFVVHAKSEDCVVTIKNGTMSGLVFPTADPNKKFCSYSAIPFAAPPTGALRFKAPQPANAWGDAILNATTFPNWCPQKGKSARPNIKMSEDCLYLNVYVPKDAANASHPFPVMIWLHGGGFTSGNSLLYTPDKLLARGDVILVVVHYRLGTLGFLSTFDEVSPGNYGLKDQSQSIRWVNENIAAFGGNPNKVTVFGESAGGASTTFQLITPLNKGIIHRVIAQSGSALSSWGIDPDPLASAKLMAKRFGCPVTNSKEIVSCMRTMSWEKIIEEQEKYSLECYKKFTNPHASIYPVVEPDLPGAFITATPAEIIKSGDIPDIPVVLGATKHDGSFILAALYLAKIGPEKLDKNPEYMRQQMVPNLLKFFSIQEQESNRLAASSMEEFYLSGVNRSSWDESMPGLVDLTSVGTFKSSIEHTAELLVNIGRKVYLYSFEYHSKTSLFTYFTGGLKIPVEGGVTHGDELIYIFSLPVVLSETDKIFSQLLCDMWINIGVHGNPTPSPSDRYEQWPTYDKTNEAYMKINNTPTAQLGFRNSWRPNGFEWN